jgi:hypothetical protein
LSEIVERARREKKVRLSLSALQREVQQGRLVADTTDGRQYAPSPLFRDERYEEVVRLAPLARPASSVEHSLNHLVRAARRIDKRVHLRTVQQFMSVGPTRFSETPELRQAWGRVRVVSLGKQKWFRVPEAIKERFLLAVQEKQLGGIFAGASVRTRTRPVGKWKPVVPKGFIDRTSAFRFAQAILPGLSPTKFNAFLRRSAAQDPGLIHWGGAHSVFYRKYRSLIIPEKVMDEFTSLVAEGQFHEFIRQKRFAKNAQVEQRTPTGRIQSTRPWPAKEPLSIGGLRELGSRFEPGMVIMRLQQQLPTYGSTISIPALATILSIDPQRVQELIEQKRLEFRPPSSIATNSIRQLFAPYLPHKA